MGDLPGSPRVAPLFLFLFFFFFSGNSSSLLIAITFEPCGTTLPTTPFRKASEDLIGVPKGLKTIGAVLEAQIRPSIPFFGPFKYSGQQNEPRLDIFGHGYS